jgi:hypothetical protein
MGTNKINKKIDLKYEDIIGLLRNIPQF